MTNKNIYILETCGCKLYALNKKDAIGLAEEWGFKISSKDLNGRIYDVEREDGSVLTVDIGYPSKPTRKREVE